MGSRMKTSVIGIIFFVGVLLIMLPDISEVPEERMTSISMTMCISDIRKNIKSDLEKGRSIKTDYKNNCPQLISKLDIQKDGSIEMFNQANKINLSFKPALAEGKVKWSCSGTPNDFVPKACRQKSQSK